jgi:acyl-[acyl-carrier-protein]-phospholipid O-acyltransferase/long-chain-fatty-acid--[acyl-carrier-protein] ligase
MKSANQFSLFFELRFGPLFVTQALGAFNDNAFKQALVILVTFVLAERQGINAALFINVAAGLFILPFFFFSATAGQMAERYDKAMLARRIKLAEIAIMGFAAIGFLLQSPYWLLAVLFCMGTQSSFFGPIKYGILPQHLKPGELVAGNALIESATLVAILLGTLFGGLLITTASGRFIVSVAIIALAIAGWYASRSIPSAPPTAPELKIDRNFLRATFNMTRHSASNRDLFLCILGLSWFWLVGSVFLTQLPAFTRSVLGAGETVSNLFIALFTIGVAIGALLNNKLLRGKVSARYVPLAGLGISIFGLDFALANGLGPHAEPDNLMSAGAFMAMAGSWRIVFDLFALAICGGLFSVPLYALIQRLSEADRVSRNIAVNNVLNAAFMAGAAAVIAVLVTVGWTVPMVLALTAALNILVAFYAIKLLPVEIIKNIGRQIFRLVYRVEVQGLENFEAVGGKAVIVANHTSFIDGPLLACFLPGTTSFAIDKQQSQRWLIRPFLSLFKLLPIDPRNPMAIKTLVRDVRAGNKCMIFPEGRLTTTGALMKVYDGPATVAHLAGAPLLPIRISGAQYSAFSRLRGILPHKWFPKVTITILEPQRIEVEAGLHGAGLRERMSSKLYDLMTGMMFATSDTEKTLFTALLDARSIHGGRHLMLEDIKFEPMSYSKLVTGSFVLGRKMDALTPGETNVALLLPNANAAVVAFFALQAFGRVPAMLNFSAGARAMISACSAAQVKTVFTSRAFIEAGNLATEIEALSQVARIVYLEDLREQIGTGAKLFGLVCSWIAPLVYSFTAGKTDANAPGVILFTSGSEGEPKGVVLSHSNLNANCQQISARIDFTPKDTAFNALPVFHAFGLTGGLLLPLFSGVRTFLYPSPLHYRAVPELIYDTNATVMFGTDTFLAGYARMANPYDFYSMRYVVAGAEAVREETRKVWMEKFGLRILEGYGATETAPVISLNTPMHNKPGSVGRMLPGIEHKLEPVEGIHEGGKLVIRGPNVMKGYLRTSNPGVLETPFDGWYDTGDIVAEDEQGFITILGRVKRFAKIAGEMVSLPGVEAQIASHWPEHSHAVVKIPDARKGEQLVLVTTHPNLTRKHLITMAKKAQMADLCVPRQIIHVGEVPLLGTGKTDYLGAEALALQELGKQSSS